MTAGPNKPCVQHAEHSLAPWLFIFFCMPLFMAPISTAGSSISGALFTVLYLASGYWRNWRVVTQRRWFWPLIAILAINVFGLLWTEDWRRAEQLLTRLFIVPLALAGATIPWQERHVKWMISLFLSGLLLNAVIGLLQWLQFFPWGPMEEGVGPTGFANHIFLSLALTNAILWLLYDIKQSFLLKRPYALLLAAIFFLQLATIVGRSGQLALCVLLPVALWYLYEGAWRKWATASALLVLLILLAAPQVRNNVQQALNDIRHYQAGDVTNSQGMRLVFWEGALKMAWAHPLLGVGTGDYAQEMARLQERGQIPNTPGYLRHDNPHNSYLAYLADLGFPGLFVLLWLLVAIFRESWRAQRSPEGWFKLSYIGIFLVGSLTDTLIWGHDHVMMLAIIAALPVLTRSPSSPQQIWIDNGTPEIE